MRPFEIPPDYDHRFDEESAVAGDDARCRACGAFRICLGAARTRTGLRPHARRKMDRESGLCRSCRQADEEDRLGVRLARIRSERAEQQRRALRVGARRA